MELGELGGKVLFELLVGVGALGDCELTAQNNQGLCHGLLVAVEVADNLDVTHCCLLIADCLK